MNIGDKAEQADSDEVRLARDSMGVYRLESEMLTEADEISDEDSFPQYGDFLKAKTTTGGANPTFDVPVWVECPSDLAQQLVELEVEPGDGFRIQQVQKNGSGEWQYSVVSEDLPTDS
jgi:hypothetical protein